MTISRVMLPLGFVPTNVPETGVKAPPALRAKPEMVEDAEFEVYTNWPLGVTTSQQVPAPSVGTLALTGVIVRWVTTGGEEIAEAFAAPAGPVSATRAAPLGANETANPPGPALGFTTI